MGEFQQVIKDGAKSLLEKIKKGFLALLIIATVLGALFVWACGWTYSDGTRAGYLTKLSNKGVVFKTYEGKLNLGGFDNNEETGVIGNIWDFSVTKESVYQELQNMEGKKVKLHYRQRYKSMPWQGKTTYFIDKVEAID